ncbi:aldo/keto reductase [Xanthobacter autotrophicus DSM 431]|uniref:aldo/keto reductase n=1 Tax=Xanthobacter nonsaccharivorans TaxID=3119912 RepID=UPI00372A7DB0
MLANTVAPQFQSERASDPMDRRHRLVLGTFTLAEAPQDVWDAVLDEYVAAGGEWVDTAFAYGHGEAERKLGSYLRRRSASLRISTKIGHFSDHAAYRDPGALLQAFEQSRERLGRLPDQILLHEADWRVWWHKEGKPFEIRSAKDLTDGGQSAPCLAAVRKIADQFAIRWGISGNNTAPLMHAAIDAKPDVILVAKQLDLLWRTAEPLAARAQAGAYDLWLGSPFHQGWLFRLDELAAFGERCNPDVAQGARDLAALLSRVGTGLVELAIPFLLDRHDITRIAVGVRQPGEITQVLASAERSLSKELMAEIDRIGFRAPPMKSPMQKSEPA